jgi:hypothetical protein
MQGRSEYAAAYRKRKERRDWIASASVEGKWRGSPRYDVRRNVRSLSYSFVANALGIG